jgi:hypothetical protein
MSERWTCTDGWRVEKEEEEERTRWTLTLNDATLRASFPCFPLFPSFPDLRSIRWALPRLHSIRWASARVPWPTKPRPTEI